ncbi:histidine phosphatase family protein [Sphingomonas sp. S1-29]|uniref:histidine phosphatase family protein n=1 Tax=Sphingomonas sp. S1-29 TaxID=2991074 RepID=UPI0022401B65|nr:histidine phosphatase family protein [Sphingomonas sp. S1-29]UZK69333.1 histidine phosphatase family protein [Sphingomonas sp. S1-29]
MILLVRHPAVARAWAGRCYGVSDVGLSRAGAMQMHALLPALVAWGPTQIVHSGLRRAAVLAEAVAKASGAPIAVDPRWRERDFGAWEGRSWQAIYRATGNAMDGMIDAPDSFRPGGGETTSELAARAVAGCDALPAGRVLVVSHGGPIAALLGSRAGAPPRDWLKLVPPTGGTARLRR